MLPESQLEENGLALLTSLKQKQFTLAEDLILILAISYCVGFSIQQKNTIFQADQGSNVALFGWREAAELNPGGTISVCYEEHSARENKAPL